MFRDPLGDFTLEMNNGNDGYNVGTSPASAYTSPINDPTKKKRTFTVSNPSDPSRFTGYDFGTHAGREYSYDNPAEGAKYAVSNYLQNIDPSGNWAQDAAAYLNQQYGSNIFRADGNQRLSYGDEFVDSDPTRFGGKFFWGSNGSGGSSGTGTGSGVGTGSGNLSQLMGGHGGSIQDAIGRLLARGEKPVTREDVAAMYEPAAASMERGAQLARAASAQRRAVEGTGAMGGGGGANDSDVNSINEDLATGQSKLMAQMMSDEITARRQDVANALQFAQGEEKMQLEKQLAEMDNQLKALGLSQSNQQFYDNLSWQMSNSNNNSMLQQLLSLFK